MFKQLSFRNRVIIGILAFVAGFALLFVIGKLLGLLIADILDADISVQIYQIVVMLGFGAMACVYFITFKKVRTHIKNFGRKNPGSAFGMQRMHVLQGVFMLFFIAWIAYAVSQNIREILDLI